MPTKEKKSKPEKSKKANSKKKPASTKQTSKSTQKKAAKPSKKTTVKAPARKSAKSKSASTRKRKSSTAVKRGISEHKQVEETGVVSDNILEIIPKALPVLVAYIDKEQRYRFANDKYEKWLGIPASEVIGKKVVEVLGPEVYEIIKDKIETVLRGESVSYEVVLPFRNGKTQAGKASHVPHFDKNNRVIGYVLMVENITERKRVEKALQEAIKKLKDLESIINRSPAMVFLWPIQEGWPVEFVSENVKQILGYTAEEFVSGKVSWPGITHHEDVPRLEAEVAEYLEKGITEFSQEYRLITKAGEIRWMRDQNKILFDSNGAATHIQSIVLDTTDRKLAEEALRESNDRFSSTLRSMSDLVFVLDRSGVFIDYYQPEDRPDLYAPPQVFIGKHPHEVLPPPVARQLEDGIKKVEATNLAEQFDYSLEIAGEKRWFFAKLTPRRAKSGEFAGVIAVVRDITERKRAEDALIENEEKYRNLVENLSEIIYTTDENAVITYVSPNIESISRYSQSEVIGRNFTEFVYHEDLPDRMKQFQKIMSGNIEASEYRCLRKDNDIIWVRTSARPIMVDDRLVGIQGVLVDITDRKRAEDALEESEKKFRTFMESASDLMHIADKNGNFTYVNESMAGTLGYSKDEMIGMHITQVISKETLKIFDQYLKELHTKGEITVEPVWVTKDGKEIYGEVKVVAFYDKDGNFAGSSGVFRDITERKRAEKRLHVAYVEAETERENWEAVFQAVPVGVLLLDEELNVTQINDVIELMFSSSRKDIIGERLGNTLGCVNCLENPEECGYGADCLKCPLRNTLNDVFSSWRPVRGVEVFKIFFNAEEGTPIWLLMNAEPIIIDKQKHMLVTLMDITERKSIEQMKGEFISVVSHELRTPLTSIIGSLGLLRGGVLGELSEQAGNLIDIAHRNSERLVRLINDILDIEKIESGKMFFDIKPIELMPLVEQVMEANRSYMEKFGAKLELVNILPDVKVKADGDRLVQVITNLLSNAAKFSPTNGTVEISVSRHNNSVRVSVTDHGPGVPEELHNRIFSRFVQADSSDARLKGGSGLGLNISKSIIEKLEGRIGFETQENVGTTFYFDLPEWK